LGRGLEALLNSTGDPVQGNLLLDEPSFEPTSRDQDAVMHLNVNEIEENPFQPRRDFSESEIASLAESLKEHDMLQPILVRVVDGRYQLISGERRLRAAIKANWVTIPARIREADDRLVSELAIVENLQRKDLNAIEKALSFKRYLEQHRCKTEILAERLKIDRSTIANLIRLLELPVAIQEWIITGKITAGHAKALLPLGDEKIQVEFAEQIIREGMTVRAVEAAVGELLAAEETLDGGAAMGLVRRRRSMDAQIEALQQSLKQALGTRVKIKFGTKQNGQIIVHFANPHEFDRLRSLLESRAA
jgi:ParB family chromosome partitioning protein